MATFHAGAFADAVYAGRKPRAGISAAVKAQMIYANYLEKFRQAKLALLEEAAGWAEVRRDEAPKLANAHYFYAYALGRYSQGISITRGLAQGFGGQGKDAADDGDQLEPKTGGRAHRVRVVPAEITTRSAGSSPA